MVGLEVSGLDKSLGGTTVLRGVSLGVPAGTLTAILGASGAGKTTLLRVIAGFEKADAGTVTLDGSVVDDSRRRVPPERRHIGYVPQDGALFPHLTVRANAAFALPRRLRSSSERVDEMLGMLGLSGLADRYPNELSGGQQQRVAIARALVSSPRLVLLDEPFASLDASLRSSVRADVLGVLRATGTTAILVTHDQEEALSVADEVAVLRDGLITQAGAPKEVYQCPADPWTATFLGTANLLDGSRDGARVRTAFGSHELLQALGSVAPSVAPSVADEVMVMIRPEQIRLTPANGVSGISGVLRGHVRHTNYHGHDALVEVEAPGAGVVRVRTIGTEPPGPGEKVILQVDGPVVAWPCVTSRSTG